MSIRVLEPDFQPFGIDELFTPDDWVETFLRLW